MKVFLRFAISKAVIAHGLELLMGFTSSVQGVMNTIMTTAGFEKMTKTPLPEEVVTAIEETDFFASIPLWAITLIGGLFIWVLTFIMILNVYGRFFKLYMYTAIAPIPLSAFAGEPTQNIGKNFLKSYAAVCLEGTIIVLACIIFSVIARANPGFDDDLSAAAMVWDSIGQVVFNTLILVGTIKMSDRVVKEMMEP